MKTRVRIFVRVLLHILCAGSVTMAQKPFVWGEYAAENNLKQDQRLLPTSWTSQRCTIFPSGEPLPASKKCQDGTPCTDRPCPDGNPCVCNNGQRDDTPNPGFTGNGITCNTLEPCMFNKIDESRMADCLPECTTLQRTNIVQLTRDITKSCDYASNQRVLQCGNCFLRLCQFENTFNPTMMPCAAKYYADIWPCYKEHYKQFCQLDMPVCSAHANGQLTISSLVLVSIFAFEWFF